MNNKGFSIVNLITTITVLVVLVGVVCPFALRVAEKTRRMKDVYEASEIARQVQLMAAYESGISGDIFADAEHGTHIIDLQKDPTALSYFDSIPESATDPDYAWNVHYDVGTGKVESILLVEKNDSGSVVSQMEVYPNYSDFIKAN